MMGTQVLLTIPDDLYRRAQRAAQAHQQEVSTLLVEAIAESSMLDYSALDEQDEEQIVREMEAYRAMHARLLAQYPGQFVAIYGGELVDRDADPVALSKRINEKYPDDFVWISQIKEQPIRTLHTPSFRLVR